MIIAKNDNCTGCMACLNVCPVGAIEEQSDKKGFYVPTVNEDKCINCKQCVKTCPANNDERITFNSPKTAYIGKSVKEVRMLSSSGGMFKPLSDVIISLGGVVYGAQFDEDLYVEHERALDADNSLKFCGSKYIESRIGKTFSNVLRDLNEGKYVYFSGTACQVSGLLSFLDMKKANTERLYTQDFVCHGVGSPQFFQDYLKYYEGKVGAKAVKANFRTKTRPGKLQILSLEFANGKKHCSVSTSQDYFFYHFHNNIIIRDTCFSCKYAKVERVADITLGDCFNVKANELKDDGLGISYMQVNTSKGEELLNKMAFSGELAEVDYTKYIQPNMRKPSTPNSNYNVFWDEYCENGYYSATKKYGNRNTKNAIKRLCIYIVTTTGMDTIIKSIRKRK